MAKGIGPQGLGLKGNNGYHIGSPAKKLGGHVGMVMKLSA